MGVPDWSRVTGEPARQALAGIVEVARFDQRWAALDEGADRLRRAVLEHYARRGEMPSRGELAEAVADVDSGLAELERRDLIVLDDAGAVTGVYPFSAHATGHRVRLDGQGLNAMCAVDALGVGAMYGRDVVVHSTCRGCGGTIHVETAAAGTELASAAPAGSVVWVGRDYADGCAATSLCTTIAMWCCQEHLDAWRAENPGIEGYRLTLAEALEVGVALFADRLAPASLDGKDTGENHVEG